MTATKWRELALLIGFKKGKKYFSEVIMTSQENTNNSLLMKAPQVASVLGISRSMAYRLIQQGIIPSVRINHAVRVRPCDLEAYIQKNWSGWAEPSIPVAE